MLLSLILVMPIVHEPYPPGLTEAPHSSSSDVELRNEPGVDTPRLAVNSGAGPEQGASLVDLITEFWSRNLRYAFDFSYRRSYNPRTDDGGGVLALGIDLHNVISNESQDIGTLLVQLYATRLDNVNPHPYFFESGDDWELVYRNTNFNYTQPFKGYANIRVGHYELPFGLEYLVDTNGTLHDYILGRNLGEKGDWGVTINGEVDGYEYEVGWAKGTGQEWEAPESTGIVVGRFGTPRDAMANTGLSFFTGKVNTGAGVIDRSRVGWDGTVIAGPVDFKAEISYGEDFDTDILNSIFEVNWRDNTEEVFAYAQLASFLKKPSSDWEDATQSRIGVLYRPNNNWSLSAQWTQDLAVYGNGHRNGILLAQARYRF